MSILPFHRQNQPVQRANVQLFKSSKDKVGHGCGTGKLPAAVLAIIFVGVFCSFGFSQEAVVLSEFTTGWRDQDPLQKETDIVLATKVDDTKSSSLKSPTSKPVNTKDKLSLEQWQQVQKSTVNMQAHLTMECKPLTPTNGTSTIALMVWAYDGPPDTQRLQDSIASLPKDTKVHLWCGSTACIQRANRIRMIEHNACLQISRLNVQELAQDTPLSTWANHHVLAKLLSGHHYEHHLQLAMQLAALWKQGGVLLQPGVRYQAGNFDIADSVGTCEGLVAQEQPMAGGLWGMSAPQHSPHVHKMIKNFLSAYKWDKPIRERYDPNSWPVTFDAASLTTSTFTKTSLGSACPDKDFVDGHTGPTKYYGTLNYDERHEYLINYLQNYAMNLGDETQGLAGIQALPRLDAFVERDHLETVKFIDQSIPPLFQGNTSRPDDGRRVQVFFNAWWGTPTMTWPPPKYIDPITISMHVQPIGIITNKFKEIPPSILPSLPSSPTWMKSLSKYVLGILGRNEKEVTQMSSNPPIAPYLKSQAPIGARDTKTLNFLRYNGIQSLFSACLTMTLSLPRLERDNRVLVVDVDIEEQLKGLVPDHVLDRSTNLTQKLMGNDADDNVLRFVLAFERLIEYARARLVITNRLHVAMPCVALGTPVVFVHGKSLPGGGGNRMDGLDVFMHQLKDDAPLPSDFDWENPPANPKGDDFKKQVKRIQQLAICHTGISDSSRKFGVMPAEWSAGQEDEVCTRESAWSANPNAIHIATSIDANFFELVFPSWVYALSRSNPNEHLVLYILTVKLSEKQRCLLRLMALKLLPNAKVFTIPTNVAEFEKSYNTRKRGHISVATQARLLLPSILPCVQKLLWIDLDAFIVGPIRKAWNEPTGKCGITARSSYVKYMTHYKTFHPTLATWHDDYGKSFNAGVMIVDLQRLRETNFEENIVRYWATELGANDQVTFNVACNSTHGELDPSMNVFQGVSEKNTPDRSEWIIAHFQSSKKPWSEGWDASWSSQEFWQTWEDNKMTFEQVLDM